MTPHVPSAALRKAVQECFRVASRDETRPHMTGVLLDLDPEGLTVVATDGHRLRSRKVPVALVPAARDALRPTSWYLEPSATERLLGQLKGRESEVGLEAAAGGLASIDGSPPISASAKKFPPYLQVIPKVRDARWALSVTPELIRFLRGLPEWRAAMADAKKTASEGLSAKDAKLVREAFFLWVRLSTRKAVAIVSDNVQQVELAEVETNCDLPEGDWISFNAAYLTEALRGARDGTVYLYGSHDPLRADTDRGLEVVMPVRR